MPHNCEGLRGAAVLNSESNDVHARLSSIGSSVRATLVIACFAAAILSFGAVAFAQDTFNYTGGMQTFVVPPGVTEIQVEVWGAEGAAAADRLPNEPGGLGGYASGTLSVSPGQVLNIFVGGQGDSNGAGGFNGGGPGGNGSAGSGCSGGPAGGGGGATDVRLAGTALSDRVIVAGGGGGSGRDYCNGGCQPCGCGGGGGGAGGLNGVDGSPAFNCGFSYPGAGINFGGGSTQIAGGIGGPEDGGGANVGTDGSVGQGGTGSSGNYDVAGGGGGGGYYGGGGGGGAANGSGVGGGGGGGGSSYIGGVSAGTTQTGVRSADGQVVFTYLVTAAIPTVSDWGLILLGLLILTGGVLILLRKERAEVTAA